MSRCIFPKIPREIHGVYNVGLCMMCMRGFWIKLLGKEIDAIFSIDSEFLSTDHRFTLLLCMLESQYGIHTCTVVHYACYVSLGLLRIANNHTQTHYYHRDTSFDTMFCSTHMTTVVLNVHNMQDSGMKLSELMDNLAVLDTYGVSGSEKVNQQEAKDIDKQLKGWLKSVKPKDAKSKSKKRDVRKWRVFQAACICPMNLGLPYSILWFFQSTNNWNPGYCHPSIDWVPVILLFRLMMEEQSQRRQSRRRNNRSYKLEQAPNGVTSSVCMENRRTRLGHHNGMMHGVY